MLCIFLLGGLGLIRARRHLRNLTRSHALLNLSLLALVLFGLAGGAVIGCGGGSSTKTPAGTSTVTITATGGSQTQTTTLSVTVQWISAREEAGLTQRDIAERLGIFHSRISKTEFGGRRRDAMELILLADLYGKTPQSFLEAE
jgi:DNA-binding XRE family transcriptional regulator